MFKGLILTMVLACGLFAQETIYDTRLIKSSGDVIDRINITTDDSITVKAQALKRDINGGLTWMDVPIKWDVHFSMGSTVDSSVQQDLTIPTTSTSTWSLNPRKAFQGYLNFTVGNKTSMKQINIAEALPSKTVFVPLTPLDSIYAGEPVRILVYVENCDGIKPERWPGIVSIKEVYTSAVKDTSITFQAKKLDTITATPSTAGIFKFKVVVTDAFKVDTICDSNFTLSVLPSNASRTSTSQPVVSSVNSNIRITTGRAGMVLDCLQPFSGQVFSLEGKTVARFTNVTSYNLKSQQMPTGKYILQASTGIGNPMQRIITLFQ